MLTAHLRGGFLNPFIHTILRIYFNERIDNMEKHTLSHYGWIVILIVILSLLISMATPFGTYIKESALSSTRSFINLTYNTLGIDRPLDSGSDYLCIENGIVSVTPLYSAAVVRKELSNQFKELNFSKKDVMEYIAYSEYSDAASIDVKDWKNSGVTTADVERAAADFIVSENSQFATAVTKEINNNASCTDARTAILNVYYDLSVQFINNDSAVINKLTARAEGTSITEDDLDTIWRAYASLLYNNRGSDVDDLINTYGADAVINMFILSNISNCEKFIDASDTNEVLKTLTKENVYSIAKKSLDISPTELDFLYHTYESIFYNRDTLSYEDMIGLVDSTLYVYKIDDVLKCLEPDARMDINRPYIYVNDNWYLEDFLDVILYEELPPTAFEIPEEINGQRVLKITKNSGFQNNEYITEIRLPGSVHTIDEYSFYEAQNLEKINLNMVKTIGQYAFSRCENLKKVELSKFITTIPYSCFSYCTSLEEVVMAEGTTSIGTSAFYGCTNLKKVTIPSTITNLSGNPFSYASSKLVIYGQAGSYAETFAKQYNYAFVAI